MAEKKKTSMSAQLKESIAVYGDGLREMLGENYGVDPSEWDQVWDVIDDDIEDDPDIQWLIGWFVGVAEARGVLPEALITLNNTGAEGKKPTRKTKVAKVAEAKPKQLKAA